MTIRDVIRIARELTDRPDAVVVRDSILNAFGIRLDNTEEAYLDSLSQLKPFRLLSVNQCILKPTVRKLGVEKIEIVRIEGVEDLRGALYGYVVNFVDKPIVVIRKNLRPCWERFTVAKELLHLYSGTSSDNGMTESGVMIRAAQDSRSLIVNESTELDDETFGFYLAIEVLLPWCLREQFNRMRDLNATSMQIAKAFMMPQCIIDHILTDTTGRAGSYLALSRRLNQNI